MDYSLKQAFVRNFLGDSPLWYKQTILGFLILNPIILYLLGSTVTGWALIFEFIFTLAMAIKCYPLQPGGLLALQAVLIGLTSPDSVAHEIENNLEVILLLMFMVAGIYFMKSMLLTLFSKVLLKVHSKTSLSLLFCLFSAVLSAFLDALTVTAVLISIGVGFFSIYHKVSSTEHAAENKERKTNPEDLEQFRKFLRSLLMHGVIGTALGGVCTLVGEPQNLLIGQKAGWDFIDFFLKMAPITIPTLFAGLFTCFMLEKTKAFGYGAKLPANVRSILKDHAKKASTNKNRRNTAILLVQISVAIFLVLALAFHLAAIGLIGLTVIILLTAFNGVTEEHQIGKAFEEALPFTALLIVFFAIVSIIHDQHLFQPIINFILTLDVNIKPTVFFAANGVLSAISDNVFVATVYINEASAAMQQGKISKTEFEALAIAINTGTNIPSVATPNGQAAFLFLLTSAVAPMIRLSYGRMVYMALPYTIVLTTVAICMVYLTL